MLKESGKRGLKGGRHFDKRWVTLEAGVLTYYKASAAKGLGVAPAKKTEKGNIALAAVSKLDKVSWKAGLVFELHTSQRVWYFKCDEDYALQAWVSACVDHLNWVRGGKAGLRTPRRQVFRDRRVARLRSEM